jgi:hypothetical protein
MKPYFFRCFEGVSQAQIRKAEIEEGIDIIVLFVKTSKFFKSNGEDGL